MDLNTIIHNHRRIMIDTAPIIYFIEENPAYGPFMESMIVAATDKECVLMTSVITLVEVLTHPLRMNKLDIAEKYRTVLVDSKNIIMYPIDTLVAERAAELRARHQLKTPDALQIAVSLENNATLFITNDNHIKKVEDIEVIVLSEFL
ncbi:MAG TPA: PIN domain-containing protein [Spirochaetota bacterium]|nr:PIN domain-containing protein [Spirochaetota bacterium]